MNEIQCRTWLASLLADDAMPLRVVEMKAATAGIAYGPLERAAEALGVQITGSAARPIWGLPAGGKSIPAPDRDPDPDELADLDVCTFLLFQLTKPQRLTALKAAARAEGISTSDLLRAGKAIGVVVTWPTGDQLWTAPCP